MEVKIKVFPKMLAVLTFVMLLSFAVLIEHPTDLPVIAAFLFMSYMTAVYLLNVKYLKFVYLSREQFDNISYVIPLKYIKKSVSHLRLGVEKYKRHSVLTIWDGNKRYGLHYIENNIMEEVVSEFQDCVIFKNLE